MNGRRRQIEKLWQEVPRDRGLVGEDLIRIALKRAREGRWKEAAND